MNHTFRISGLSCHSCEFRVKDALKVIPEIQEVSVSKETGLLIIQSDKPLITNTLQKTIGNKYQIFPLEDTKTFPKASHLNDEFSWLDRQVWKRSAFNTLNCLIGCSIGDFGMIIFLQYFYPDTSMMLQMSLSIVAGLITSVILETVLLRLRENFTWKKALVVAFGMSFLSMVAMEIAMNVTDFMITGGKMAISTPNYWLAFIPAAIMGFLVPWPYNYYKLKKYKKACH